MPEFTKFRTNSACIFIHIDMPIYDKQLQLITKGIAKLTKRAKSKWEKMVGRYLFWIAHNEYGSLVFVFDDHVLTLSKGTQEKLGEAISDLFQRTDWFDDWCRMQSVEENIGEIIEDKFLATDMLEEYIESVVNCGYRLIKADVCDLFDEVLSEEDIEKHLTLQALKSTDSVKF